MSAILPARRGLAFILVPLLALPMPVESQVALFGALEDTRYGWVFPDESVTGTTMVDAADDVSVEVAQTPLADAPAGPATAALDLRALEIAEPDDEALLVRITVAALDPATYAREHLVLRPTYWLAFSIGGRDYEVRGAIRSDCGGDASFVCHGLTPTTLQFDASLSLRLADGDIETIGDPPARVRDDGVIEILLPRWALERARTERYPMAGETLQNVLLQAGEGFSVVGGAAQASWRLHDQLPDDGPVAAFHTLASDSAGSVIRLGMPEGDDTAIDPTGAAERFGREPLRPRVIRSDQDLSATTRVRLEVGNGFHQSLLAVPKAQVLVGDAMVRVPEQLNVPGRDARGFEVVVTPGTIGPAESIVIRLDVSTLGAQRSYRDHVLLSLRNVPEPGPDAPRLYLHTYTRDQIFDPNVTTAFAWNTGALNTMADDPQDNGMGSPLSWNCLCFATIITWDAPAPLSAERFLSLEEAGVFHATIDAPAPGHVELAAFISYADVSIARGTKAVDVVQGTQEIDVPLTITDDGSRLAPGAGVFSLRIEGLFRPGADVPLSELSNLAEPLNAHLATDGASWIELPFIDQVERHSTADHLLVDLGRGYPGVQYVNPGRTTLWNITVTNQGDRGDTISLDVASDPTGWRSRLQPGQRFSVGAGESVTIAVTTRAPDDAGEGAVAKINVTVRSSVAENATAGITLTAVTTGGVDIDEPEYVADEETSSRLVAKQEKKRSPGPGVVLVAASGVLALAVGRRRRD